MNFLSGVIGSSKDRRLPLGYSLLLDAANLASYPGSGTTWFDLSGNGKDAAMQTGMTWNAGGWMDFNGVTTTGGYAVVTNGPSVTPTTGYSVLIWCYPTNLDGTNARWFLSKRTSSSSGQSFATFAFTNNSVFADVPGSVYRRQSTWNLAVNNAWQHFAICWSGASGTLDFYKNGVLDTALTSAPSSVTSQGANLQIGAGAGSTARFGGRMGHIAYYNNRGLTASEVLQAYNAHRNRYGL
jgi:hypothetical protein